MLLHNYRVWKSSGNMKCNKCGCTIKKNNFYVVRNAYRQEDGGWRSSGLEENTKYYCKKCGMPKLQEYEVELKEHVEGEMKLLTGYLAKLQSKKKVVV